MCSAPVPLAIRSNSGASATRTTRCIHLISLPCPGSACACPCHTPEVTLHDIMSRQLRLSLLIGRTVAVPAPPNVVEALDTVEVTHTDEGRSGFQLTFTAGRGGVLGLLDYPLVMLPLLRPFNRVIVILTFDGAPRVLIDGIIVDQQLVPS